MRLIKILCLALISMLSLSVEAQIKYTNWRLNINDAPKHQFLDLLINQWNGLYWTCKGTNFFQIDVSPDNPRLAGSGDQIVFFNSVSNRYNSIRVANVYQQSDARSKKDIECLSSSLPSILQLRPVSYKWNESHDNSVAKLSVSSSQDTVTVANGPLSETGVQYGFLAQDVEQVLPEVVAVDESGNKMVNYIAMIPLLVQAVQELQHTVEEQAITIEQLSQGQPQEMIKAKSYNKILSCSPNPAYSYVNVEVQCESGVEAEVIITSLSGNREKRLSLTTTVISAEITDLPSGIHLVSLYVDGHLADTCRLIKK